MKLSQNISEVFLEDSGSTTVREILARSEHRGFGFLLVIFTIPVVLPFTPPGVSAPFAVMVIIIAAQIMANRQQPWFPRRILDKQIKTGDSRFMKALKKSSEFFERFLRPRAKWVYSPAFRRWVMAPLIILAALAMMLPLPGTNSLPALSILLIALGMLEEDGVFGLIGSLLAFIGMAIAAVFGLAIIAYGPEGIDRIRSFFGR
ncbi:MAG: exopolysaccharide biosynthesis protein [Fimbriimonadaceae bacterium]